MTDSTVTREVGVHTCPGDYLDCINWGHVLVRVSIAVIKHHDPKPSWGGKDLFGLHFQIIVHHWRKSEQELKQGSNLDVGVDPEAM